MQKLDRGIISPYDMKKTKNRIIYGVMILAILVMVISMLYPMTVTLFNGLKPNKEVNSFPPTYFPNHWVWGNYSKAWNYIDLPGFLVNTLKIFVGNMAATVVIIGFAAFSLSKLNVPLQKYVYVFFMITLFIPPTTYIIPNFINLKDLGLLNTFWAFWLPAGASAYYMMIQKQFFDSINNEIFESSRIDGASEIRNFFQIAFPLSLPIFATLAIFVFSSAWNDWYWPSLVMHGDKTYPLAVAIVKYVLNVRRLDTNIKFALLTLVSLPPVVIFLIFQKFIIRGLNIGSVKG
ncbi:carbohydrate ABC transporter permease [Gorillibacterium massiliense]|uniref:carbohydrate ABC transporter permease n=1 Tax=Gorillibacterium massiliense TaxID=1280390 RepID=UPI0004ACF308|nr:carbohydrate ABC transporter permease [Gorillibacterium massiliense]